MSNDRIYPNLPEGFETRMKAVVMAAKGDPGYFTDSRCRYSPSEIEILKKVVADATPIVPVQLFERVEQGEDGSFDVVLDEVQETIEEFKAIEPKLADADTGERIQYIRAKTSLLEKWISLKERVHNAREMSRFQATVLSAMDDLMDKDQRQSLKERLKGVAGA